MSEDFGIRLKKEWLINVKAWEERVNRTSKLRRDDRQLVLDFLRKIAFVYFPNNLPDSTLEGLASYFFSDKSNDLREYGVRHECDCTFCERGSNFRDMDQEEEAFIEKLEEEILQAAQDIPKKLILYIRNKQYT